MSRLAVLLLLAGALAGRADADGAVTAGDAFTEEVCSEMRDRVIERVETYTRMKFRRAIPVRIERLEDWKRKMKADGFAGAMFRHSAAYYTPGVNVVTVVPWVIGGYDPKGEGEPERRGRDEWIRLLEPVMIHELMHGLHHQNFFSEGRLYQASLRPDLTEEDLDKSTVAFLLGEGVPELVSIANASDPSAAYRRPARELDGPLYFLNKYKPDGKQPYRIKLFENGYTDGLNLSHHVAMKVGFRGVRALLYRPPPRHVLFCPEVLEAVDLEDPPDPDAIFGFLSPALVKGSEVVLAVNPGRNRFFATAYQGYERREGCLLGYVTEREGASYAFFVADPDHAAAWREEQRTSFLALDPERSRESQVALPLVDDPVKAKVQVVRPEDGSVYVRASVDTMVVLAYEAKPTRLLEDRVLHALRALYTNRPKPNLYADAKAAVLQKLAE